VPQEAKESVSRTNGDVPVAGTSRASSSKSAQAIWDQRVLGFSIHEISQQTGLSVEKVGELLESYHRSIKPQGIEFHRQLALSRIEALLKVYLPQALSDSVTIERIRAGEPVAEEDVEYPLRCAVFCLAALKFVGELLNLRAVPEPVGGANRLSVLDWLATQRAFVKKAAEEAPSDTPELPSGQLDSRSREDLAIDHSDPNPEIEFAEIDIRRQDSQAPPQEGALSLAEPAAAVDDPDDARETPPPERQVVVPRNPQAQTEADRAERRRRFLSGEPDAL
jgi:hypothetical protein